MPARRGVIGYGVSVRVGERVSVSASVCVSVSVDTLHSNRVYLALILRVPCTHTCIPALLPALWLDFVEVVLQPPDYLKNVFAFDPRHLQKVEGGRWKVEGRR